MFLECYQFDKYLMKLSVLVCNLQKPLNNSKKSHGKLIEPFLWIKRQEKVDTSFLRRSRGLEQKPDRHSELLLLADRLTHPAVCYSITYVL